MNGENAVRTCRSHVHGSLGGKEKEKRKIGKIVGSWIKESRRSGEERNKKQMSG